MDVKLDVTSAKLPPPLHSLLHSLSLSLSPPPPPSTSLNVPISEGRVLFASTIYCRGCWLVQITPVRLSESLSDHDSPSAQEPPSGCHVYGRVTVQIEVLGMIEAHTGRQSRDTFYLWPSSPSHVTTVLFTCQLLSQAASHLAAICYRGDVSRMSQETKSV